MLKIPITLARRPGYEHVPDSYTSPVITMNLICGPEVTEEGIRGRPESVPIRVLLDTGADTGWVDESLLKRLGAFCIGEDREPTKTLHDEKLHSTYFVGLELPGQDWQFGVPVTGLPIQDGSRAYEAILGMEFLKLGRLVVDGAGESFFELREN